MSARTTKDKIKLGKRTKKRDKIIKNELTVHYVSSANKSRQLSHTEKK